MFAFAQVANKSFDELQVMHSVDQLKEGSFLISFLDLDKNIVEETLIMHPLLKNLEYVNDYGNLEQTSVKLEKEIVTLRTQDDGQRRFVKIEHIVNGEKSLIKNFELPVEE